MEPYQKVHGLILRSRVYKEADQIVTLYTQELGKIAVQARGIKKKNSKLRAGLLLFSQSEVVLLQGKGFPIVVSASLEKTFTALHGNLRRMSYASYAAELFDQMVVERQPEEELFLFLMQTFYLLEQIDPWLAVCRLEEQLLEQQGYGLQLEHCLHCGCVLRGETFRAVQGGLLCFRCAGAERGHLQLSQEGLTLLRAVQRMPLHQFGRIYSSRQGRVAVEQYMELQLQQVLSYPIKSRDFLKQVNME